jgi:hypothetical protein
VSELFDEHGRPLDEELDVEALARAAGLSTHTVVRVVVLGLIDPVGEPDMECVSWSVRTARFRPDALARIARIQRLRRHLSVPLAGVGVVLELLERVETLERELERRGLPTRSAPRG